MKHITDNIREVIARQNERRAASMFIGVTNNEDIDAIYHNTNLSNVHDFLDMIEKIHTLPNKHDILAFLDSNGDYEALVGLINIDDVTDADVLGDDYIDSDSDSDTFEIQNSEEDQPILTTKQQNEIMELKPLLKRDGMRPKWYFTKNDFNIGIMITKICNNNHQSYILGLEQLFNTSRAKAILNKIIS